MGGNKGGGGYFVFKILTPPPPPPTNTNRLHPDIRCAPTLFGKGSQVETARSWPEQPNLFYDKQSQSFTTVENGNSRKFAYYRSK